MVLRLGLSKKVANVAHIGLAVTLLTVVATGVGAYLTTYDASAVTCASNQIEDNGVCTDESLNYCQSGQTPAANDCVEQTDPTSSNNGEDTVTKYLNPFTKLLTGLVGIVAVLSVIVAGIQYASATDDPGKVTAAKKRIYNTVLALVVYLFLAGFLQWLLPGGLV